MKACFFIGVLLLVIGGCSLVNSFDAADRLARVPRMTCEELARDGAPDDGQVALTDLKPCGGGFVGRRFDDDLILYIPTYPAGLEKEPAPHSLRFLLQVWSDEDRQRLLDRPGPEETCWATKGARIVPFSRGPGEVEDWAARELLAKYPGIDLANVWVLTFGHGNTPTAERVRSSWHYGIGGLGIGAAIVVLGAALAWRRLAPV